MRRHCVRPSAPSGSLPCSGTDVSRYYDGAVLACCLTALEWPVCFSYDLDILTPDRVS